MRSDFGLASVSFPRCESFSIVIGSTYPAYDEGDVRECKKGLGAVDLNPVAKVMRDYVSVSGNGRGISFKEDRGAVLLYYFRNLSLSRYIGFENHPQIC